MKKKIILIASILLIIVIIVAIVLYINSSKLNNKNEEEIIRKYFSNLKDGKYEEMYEQITEENKQNTTKEKYIERNKKIYEGIELSNINVEIKNKEKIDSNKTNITYNIEMQTKAGNITFENATTLNKENKQYKINWSSDMIYPNLKDDDKIKVKTTEAKRGNILDRNGKMLAGESDVSSVGFVPQKMRQGEEKNLDLQKVSELLDVTVEKINSLLNASWVKQDSFVPIKKVAKSDTELKEQLLQIPGIKITTVKDRYYPLAEKAAHLTGYVQNITADELKTKDGYTANSIIGKTGIEKQYEEKLKGKNGIEIYIEDKNGEKKKSIANVEVKDGENIKLTVDSELQSSLYDELKNDKGFFVVMNHSTGEVLALVSTPSYNPNNFVFGLGTTKWNELKNDEAKPMTARYLQSWCPGSTFKSITGAIGLSTGKLSENDEFTYNGLSWKKDNSWGDYEITTLTSYSGPKNLKNAIIHSDNIYFAQAALKIGKDTFTNSLKKIKFGENIEFELGILNSQFANKGNIQSETLLADSGYGQGEILVNPIHMASIYSAFVNNGNMLKPYLEYKENAKGEYIVEQAFSEQAAEIIKENLIQVVENPEGTAKDMKIQGKTIAGKTGTAELKASKDENGETLGWFDCINIDDEKPYIIVGMVENASQNGGSHYIIKKIHNILE